MQYLSLTFQECMQTLPQKMSRKKSKRTHTLRFWKFAEWHTIKRIKNALEIGYQHFKRSPNFSIFVVKYPIIYEIFNQIACLKMYLVRRWLTSKTKKNLSKNLLKNDWNKKFQLYYLKVSSNVKIAMHCFENFVGGEMPQMPPLVARLPLRYTEKEFFWKWAKLTFPDSYYSTAKI